MIVTSSQMSQNQTITCDVCVVGSGAGGGVVAKELAEAGLHVIVLEEGSYLTTRDYMTNNPVASMTQLYRDAGSTVIFGTPNIIFGEGRCVGGSTVVNGATCWRTPKKILKRWQWEYGLVDISPETLESTFERVETMIHAKPMIPEATNQESELLKRGAERLGYKVHANIRSQNNCVGTNLCFNGCPTGAKQSIALSYIPAFLKSGGQIYTHCRVNRVVTKSGQVTGVDATIIDPVTKKNKCRLRVRSKLVFVCGGAIQTPHLLLKSGIRDEAHLLGKNLLVHPNAKVLAVFDEKVESWHGVNQGYQITEYFDEGLLMAVNSVTPGLMALAIPNRDPKLGELIKDEFHHMVMGGVLIEDTGTGQVRRGPWDTAIPFYNINEHDFQMGKRGVALLAEVFFAAGARKCYLPFSGLEVINSIDEIPKIFDNQLRPIHTELLTVHIMGTARMGADPKRSVVNGFGECHNVKGLYVADASVIPSSIGVNPQLTIMTLATRSAHYAAEQFGRY